MRRRQIVLHNDADRQTAIQWALTAPAGTRVDFKEKQRSILQNNRMWAMLGDIAEQKEHCGRKYHPDQWKALFLHSIGHEVEFLPALDKSTFIPWGQSSSDLTKGEMSDLIDFMLSWGAQNGVVFHDEQEEAA